jgi:hypothetical protein
MQENIPGLRRAVEREDRLVTQGLHRHAVVTSIQQKTQQDALAAKPVMQAATRKDLKMESKSLKKRQSSMREKKERHCPSPPAIGQAPLLAHQTLPDFI